jgi:AbrB family looped-hinge helix DNA binding protein
VATATLTSKGQITLPKEVRDRLGLSTGDRVAFVADERGVYSIMPATRDIRELKGIVGAPKRAVSLAEMDEAIAAHARSKARRK